MKKNSVGVPGTVSCWLRENADNFEDREAVVAAALKEFPGKNRQAVIRRLNELATLGAIKPKPPTSDTPKGGRKPSASGSVRKAGAKKVPRKFRMAIDVSQVKDEYDDEAKIDEGIANLGTSVIKDNDFRIELGVAQDRWKLVSTLKKYEKNRIELRGKQFRGTFWGQEEVLEELRRKIDMT